MSRQYIALSGLAMVLIVLNHSIHMALTIPPELGYSLVEGFPLHVLSLFQALGAAYAVPVFLFISGSFVGYAARGVPPSLSRKFLVGAIAHIFWPYLVWSLVFYGVEILHSGAHHSPIQYLKFLVVGYPFHFIPLLIFSYILSPFIIRVRGSHYWILMVFIGLFQIFLLSWEFPGVLGYQLPNWTKIFVPPVISKTLAQWGVYFPLGLVYSINSNKYFPVLQKYRWILMLFSIGIFTLGFLDSLTLIDFTAARFLSPLPLVLLLPVIKRDHIPQARQFEAIGKRSYGLYLTHLIVIDLTLLSLQRLFPRILELPLVLFPLLFFIGLSIPLILMDGVARKKTRKVYAYVFG